MIFERRTSQGEAMAGVEAAQRLCRRCCRVLHELGLVDDHHVPRLSHQQLNIARQKGVGRQHNVIGFKRLEFRLAVDAMLDQHRELRCEAVCLRPPVRHEAGRRDDEAGSVKATRFFLDGEMGQNLHGLAQAHIVCQQPTEPGFP